MCSESWPSTRTARPSNRLRVVERASCSHGSRCTPARTREASSPPGSGPTCWTPAPGRACAARHGACGARWATARGTSLRPATASAWTARCGSTRWRSRRERVRGDARRRSPCAAASCSRGWTPSGRSRPVTSIARGSSMPSRPSRQQRRRARIAAATTWTRRQVAADPLDEEAHRRLMARLDRSGDRAGALTVYERLSARLRRDLATAPAAATRALAERIRRGEDGAGEDPPDRSDAGRRPAAGTPPLVGRDAELAELLAAWHSAQDGDGQVVVLAGEAGIGRAASRPSSSRGQRSRADSRRRPRPSTSTAARRSGSGPSSRASSPTASRHLRRTRRGPLTSGCWFPRWPVASVGRSASVRRCRPSSSVRACSRR